uniref:EB domain-containing protein n=1 Tax=Magallana gigas TaxID=29159 RepID=A0A8W8M5M9_MAGGI
MEKKYEIARMEIYFVSSSYRFVRDKACGNYSNTHFNITIGCAGEYVHDGNIGESCVRDQQCVSFNSTCNKTSGMCQCKTGHVYHRKTDTCEPEPGLNESCDNNLQRSVAIPNATCNDTTGVCTCGGHVMVVDTRVNVESINSNLTCNELSNNEEEGIDIYNHLHGDNIELSVQSDYEYVQQQVTEEDDYSHVTRFNANHIQISGDYGVIS